MITFFIVLGAVIIAALASYAGFLLAKLNRQQKAQQQAQLEGEQKQQEQVKSTLNSLLIIARSVQQDQCDISEGSWRICVLIESHHSGPLAGQLAQYPSIQALYEGIKHMPILEERKKLDKKTRMKLDFDRMKLESQLNDEIRAELETLANFAQDQLQKLS